MICPECNQETKDNLYCSECGIDIELCNKIKSSSKQLYNSALNKINDNDLSGGIRLLKRSLEFDKSNNDSRNLLGLAYFQVGEIGKAIKQWKISISLCETDQIAKNFLVEARINSKKVDYMNSSIKMYNEALSQIQQKSEDLAIIRLKRAIKVNPNFIKALNLLAICYIHQGNNAKAIQVVNLILQIDVRNFQAIHVKKEISDSTQEKDSKDLNKVENSSQYFEKISNQNRKNVSTSQILMFIIGLVCGILVVYVLISPAVIDSLEQKNQKIVEDNDKKIKELNKELENKTKQISDISSENSKIEKENQQLKLNVSQLEQDKKLLVGVDYYFKGDKNQTALQLLNVEESNLSFEEKEVYKYLKDKTFDIAVRSAYSQGYEYYTSNDYSKAKEYFLQSKSFEIETSVVSYNLYYLGRCYEEEKNYEKAKSVYEEIIEKHSTSKMFWSAKTRLKEIVE